MAHDAKHIESAPTNGDALHHPLNQTTEQVFNSDLPRPNLAESLARVHDDAKALFNRSRIKPSKLYEIYFGSRSLTVGQLLSRSFDDPLKEFPQQLIGLLQSRIKGAAKRIDTRKTEIQKYRVSLNNRVVVKHGKSVALTAAERESVQHKKLLAEAGLLMAKEDLGILRAYLKEAVNANSSPVRKSIQSVREIAFAKKMAPSISQRIIDQMVAAPGLKRNFFKVINGDEKFLDVLKMSDEQTYKMLLSKPRLATQVKEQVLKQITVTAK
jgi:hypothetical protein